jgi:hypothetical protein
LTPPGRRARRAAGWGLAVLVPLLLCGPCGCDQGAGQADDAGRADRQRDLSGGSGGGDDGGGGGGDDTGSTQDVTAPDEALSDGNDDAAGADLQEVGGIPSCITDEDHDGHIAATCGGDDCDDQNAARHPGLAEGCDFLDNDCNGHVNDGITCSFYAQTDQQLYEVDPFRATARRITSVPALWDLDTAPDGTLYGVSADALYRLDQGSGTWIEVGPLGSVDGEPNGLAIDLDGRAYITSGDTLYTVDLSTGAATLVGSMGGGFVSSGDCVVNKDNTLFMSSKQDPDTDWLIRIDGQTGRGEAVGPIGHTHVFGLTAAWGYLFGLASNGDLLSIDDQTGAGTVIATFSDDRWFGAASTPSR